MTQPQTRAAIYTRISDDDDGLRLGVERQLADCTSLCESRGWSVSPQHVFEDNDISASKGQHRPGYERLLATIQAHHVDAVVTYHLDRLTRRPLELEQFLDACQLAKLSHFATVTGDFDLGSDDARFTARILGAVARKEADAIGRRVRRAAGQRAVEGRVNGGGRRSLGYTLDRQVIPEEAVLIAEIVQRVLAHESLMSICVDFDARGVRGAGGGRLTVRSLGRYLRNPLIAGLRTHHGDVVGQGQWEALVPREEWERVVRVLNARTPVKAAARAYLLAGLVRCECGAPMVAMPTYRTRSVEVGMHEGSRVRVLEPRYGCRPRKWGGVGCGHVSILADPRVGLPGGGLEPHVVATFLDALARPLQHAERSPLEGHGVQELRDAIDADSAALIELDDDYRVHRVIDRATWLRVRGVLNRRLDLNRQHLDSITVVSVEVDSSDPEHWDSLSFDRQRAVLRYYIDHVKVRRSPTGRVVPLDQRVKVEWSERGLLRG